ncbi:MAG: hypothetical protein IT328_22145 [Caldilineaceae bacterium]|nr:hypothetical protein [Caldilineaceae bacterium]
MMLRYTVPLICLTLALLVGGCVVQPITPETPAASTQEPTTEEAASTTDAGFSTDRLSNLEYQLDAIELGPIQLADGHYEDVANRIAVDWVNTYALGELNGVPAAAVVLSANTGGSGTFSVLAVVVEEEGALVNVADALIGDRIRINSIGFDADEIVLDFVTQGPDEPMCCGTQRTLTSFALQDEQLTATETEVIGVQEQISETVVMTFTPQVIPAETRAGSCFTNAISVSRADAWRCTTDNQIHDPCFQVDDAPTLVCGADPISGEEGFVLELTEPLPAVEVYESDRAWLIQLGDGTICGMMTGTVPGVGDQVAPYGCADEAQSYLMEQFNTEFPLWFAQDVTFDVGENGFSIRSSVMKPVATVWR